MSEDKGKQMFIVTLFITMVLSLSIGFMLGFFIRDSTARCCLRSKEDVKGQAIQVLVNCPDGRQETCILEVCEEEGKWLTGKGPGK